MFSLSFNLLLNFFLQIDHHRGEIFFLTVRFKSMTVLMNMVSATALGTTPNSANNLTNSDWLD